jgi:hypothetical protein
MKFSKTIKINFDFTYKVIMFSVDKRTTNGIDARMPYWRMALPKESRTLVTFGSHTLFQV